MLSTGGAESHIFYEFTYFRDSNIFVTFCEVTHFRDSQHYDDFA